MFFELETIQVSLMPTGRQYYNTQEEYLDALRRNVPEGVLSRMGGKERPKGVKEEVSSSFKSVCRVSCEQLQNDYGESSSFELDDVRNFLRQRMKETGAGTVDYVASARELACLNMWETTCETNFSKCDSTCDELIPYLQSGSSKPLSSRAKQQLLIKAESVTGDRNRPRNDVINANRWVNCLNKYDVCRVARDAHVPFDIAQSALMDTAGANLRLRTEADIMEAVLTLEKRVPKRARVNVETEFERAQAARKELGQPARHPRRVPTPIVTGEVSAAERRRLTYPTEVSEVGTIYESTREAQREAMQREKRD